MKCLFFTPEQQCTFLVSSLHEGDENLIPVRIVMACYNGAPYLPQQLASFGAQSFQRWSLDVSDDGSSDTTQDILRVFRETSDHEVRVYDGPRSGVAAAFLTLARRASEAAPDHAIAFSDQDDVWSKVKLARAMRWMANAGDPQKDLLVYASRTILTDKNLKKSGLSHLHPRGPSFRNALVQNVLGGNTIVLSPAAAGILAQSVPNALAADIPYHDWWIYQILSGAGAKIFNDTRPGLYYRQHGSNHLGHHGLIYGRLQRIKKITSGHYASWISANLQALQANRALLTLEHQHLLDMVTEVRIKGGKYYAQALQDMGIYRQSPQGDYMIQIMARLGWL